MNVVLIGYRGTGKSCVGKCVAQALKWPVVSLDSEIVRSTGLSIPEIVQRSGWEAFRDLEEEACRNAATLRRHVIDCGGGVVERHNNFQVLREAGKVVWLVASPEVIVKRIRGDNQRPSLTGARSFTAEVSEVLTRRRPLYERMAHTRIDTDHQSVKDVARQVVDLIRSETRHR